VHSAAVVSHSSEKYNNLKVIMAYFC